jgi:putative hydrolase of the HAD superfamily
VKPEVLLFDLGGVLIDNVMFDELPRLLPEAIADSELRRRWLFSPSVQAFERGHSTTSEFVASFMVEWKILATPAGFLEAFASWPRAPYPGAIELLERLSGRYRLAVLSNCNPIHWDRIAEVRQRIDAAYSSHLLGMVKPDHAIFERVAKDLRTAPGRICYFDDAPANVEAAYSVGMQAHLTVGLSDVERVLHQLGL